MLIQEDSMTRSSQGLTLLIVDDEVFMREGLQVYLDWSRFGVGRILTAEDGKAAVALAKKQPIDLLMTDIKMSEMNGLELISEMHKLCPRCVCVIISGYNDFEYARKSIELGAFYYITKPLEQAELKAVVEKAVLRIEQTRQEESVLSGFRATSQKTNRYLVQQFLATLLEEHTMLSKEQLAASARELKLPFAHPFYATCVAALFDANRLTQKQLAEIYAMMEKRLRRDFPPENGETLDWLMVKNQFVAILGFHTPDLLREKLQRSFEAVMEMVSCNFHLSVVAVLGTPVSNLCDLFLSYQEALTLCDYHRFVRHRGFDYAPSSKRSSSENPFYLSVGEKEEFLGIIQANDQAGIARCLHRLQQRCLLSPYRDKHMLFSVLLELMISVTRVLDAQQLKIEQFINFELFTYGFLETFDTMDLLFDWLQSFFSILSNAYAHQDNTDFENQLTLQIKNYTVEHLSENLNLSIIADYYHYNTNYVGRLFKRYEAMSYSDYLNRRRVEQACRLLKTTRSTVEQIADLVGYHDCQYFIKVFKRYLQTTPRKYRTAASREAVPPREEVPIL